MGFSKTLFNWNDLMAIVSNLKNAEKTLSSRMPFSKKKTIIEEVINPLNFQT